jgi:signal transduction histidine kinase
LAALAIELNILCLETSEPGALLSSRLKILGNTTEQLAEELQRLAHHLHPSILEHVGVEAAIREHVEDFAARTGLTTEVVVQKVPTTVPLDTATCLYRVLQESLRNVETHAYATNVLIRLLGTGHGVGLHVCDDGRGFDQLVADGPRKGLGVTSMEERGMLVNGAFRLRTKPSEGTDSNRSTMKRPCQPKAGGSE